MPIQPSYPGVYVQEIPSGVRTITGVSTSIGAFFGRTLKGPINKAVRCLSLSDFQREFGGGHPSCEMGSSIYQFFGNGGTDCYVVRLAHNARKADLTLRNLAGVPVLTFMAKAAGTWGNNVRLAVDYNTSNPEETFNLYVTQEENGAVVKSETFLNLSMNPLAPRYVVTFVTQGSTLVDVQLATGFDPNSTAQPGASQARRVLVGSLTAIRDEINDLIYPTAPGASPACKFEISVNDGPPKLIDMRSNPTRMTATSKSGIEGEIRARIMDSAGAGSGITVTCSLDEIDTTQRVLTIRSATGNNLSVRIRRASTNDLAAALMLGIDQGGIETTRFANHRPVPTATWFSGDVNSWAKLLQVDTVSTPNPLHDLRSITFGGAPAPNAVDFEATGTNLLVTSGGADRWFKDALSSAVNNHSDGVREKLQIMAKVINDKPDAPVTAEVWGYRIAFKPKAGMLNTMYAVTATATENLSASFTTNVRQYALGDAGGSPSQNGAGQIGNDDDGTPLAVPDYTGSAIDHTGFYALDRVDLFNLMVLPKDDDIDEAEYQQLFGPASIYCESRRAFLLLDAPTSWTQGEKMDADATKVNSLRAGIVKQNSAIFFPRVKFSDAGTIRSIGPSGMLAGLLARTDSQRGVWKAPAGIEADLRGVLDVELNLTDNENGVLNKLGVNCIRKFPNGIVNWGARTLDGSDDFGSEWKYIPIRRLALFLEESLFRGTKWVVFEPNDEPLWAKIRMNVNAFMLSQFRQGAFQGSTPDKAFFVKCDGETTTANDRNLGIVNIQVGFAPLKPAEFVIISIQQIPDIV
jgi:phage tail sheath protein FI